MGHGLASPRGRKVVDLQRLHSLPPQRLGGGVMFQRRLLTDLEVVREALRLAEETNPNAASRALGFDHGVINEWRKRREFYGPQWPTDEDIAEHRAYREATAARREKVRVAAAKYRARRYLNGDRGLLTPALGTVRRLQALQAIGYTQVELGCELGVSNRRVHFILNQNAVLPRVRDAVAEIYERLCMTIPTDPDVLAPRRTRVHERQRRAAAKRGWAPPLAWDDIDDPFERPKGLRATGPARGLPAEVYQVRVAAMEDVRDRGGTLFDVQRELSISRDALLAWCTNHDLLPLYDELSRRTRQTSNGYTVQKGTAA